MKHRSYPPIPSHSHSFRRLRPPMRTNIILGGHSNYQPSISSPIHRQRPGTMDLGRFFSRQRHPYSILHLPLYPPVHHRRRQHNPPPIPSPNRLLQPNRPQCQPRQNPIPCLLLIQRRLRLCHYTSSPCISINLCPKHPGGPRQLHTSQPPRHTPPHQTRVVLPICLCHPPLYPKQTRRSLGPTILDPSSISHANPTHL